MVHTDQLGLDVHKGITWVAHLSALAIVLPRLLQPQPLLNRQQHPLAVWEKVVLN